jgi:hypothetical protein
MVTKIADTVSGLIKQAKVTAAPPVDPAAALSAHAKQMAYRDIRNVLGLGLGVGVAARGATGLYNMFRRNFGGSGASAPGPVTARIPYPVEPEEEEETLFKQANPNYITNKKNWAGYMPGMLLAGAGGLAGGWKAMDVLLDRRRKAEQKDELAQARSRFQKALLYEYAQPKTAQDSSDDFDKQLDSIFEAVQEKAAQTAAPAPDIKAPLLSADTTGGLLGLYGAYAAPMALLSGAMIYDRTRAGSRRALLEKAKKERLRRRQASRPPEVYAVPTPVSR